MVATILTTDISVVADVLLSGGVAVIPTDTVYGVAASLQHVEAVRRLFVVKQRPESVALPVMCPDIESAQTLATTWSDEAAALASAFWPGPLTLIVPTDAERAELIGGVGSIGLRVPHDDQLIALLRLTGPLAVSSANEHGLPPATSAVMAMSGVGRRADIIWDGGRRGGAVSTVVDITGELIIRREGALSTEQIVNCLAK